MKARLKRLLAWLSARWLALLIFLHIRSSSKISAGTSPSILAEKTSSPSIRMKAQGLTVGDLKAGDPGYSVKPPVGTQLNYSHPLSQGLVGCWLMNEGSGTLVLDSSGNGNHGTLTNIDNPGTATSGWTAGPNGGALAFAGDPPTNDYVRTTNTYGSIIPATSFTFAVRYSMSAGQGSYRILTNIGAGRISLTWSNNNKIATLTNNDAWKEQGPALSLNTAYQHVWSYSALLSTVYCNGAYVGQNADNNPTAYDGVLDIGCVLGGVNTPFNGIFSDVMIWNRALSQDEISYLYAQPYCMFDNSNLMIHL